MSRGKAWILASCLVACVATNPDWDEPVASATTITGAPPGTTATESGEPADETRDEQTMGETGPATTAADAGSSSTGASASTGASSEPSTGLPNMQCDAGLTLCDGMCVDADDDPRHCGPACIDCRDRGGGDDVECKHGECRTNDGDEGKGG